MLYVSTHQSCQINFMLLRRLGLADAGDRCSAPSRAEMGRQAEPHPHSTFNTRTFRHQRMHRGCATPPPSSSQGFVLGDSTTFPIIGALGHCVRSQYLGARRALPSLGQL
jgi:hypothetical protein